MAVSVDGTTQGARQRVLAVPYALKASRAESAALADSAVLAQVAQTAYTLNPQSKTWRPHPFLYYSSGSLRYSQLPMSVSSIKMCAFIPNSIKSLNSISIKGVIPPINTTYGRQGAVYIQIIKRSYPSLGQISETVPWSYTKTDVGTVDVSVPVNLTLDQNSAYCISISGGTEEGAISDILFSVTE
jgi:hypothetical protein